MTASYADGYCETWDDRDLNFWQRGSISALRLSRTTVKAGEVSTLTFRKERVVEVSMRTLAPGSYISGQYCSFGDETCSANVVTTIPGIVPVEVSYVDCAGVHTEVIQLTVQ